MPLSSQELHDIAGLNTDGITGFEAQVASRSQKLHAQAPAHLSGVRLARFEEGARLARYWMTMRNAFGIARRKARARDFAEQGATSEIPPTGRELHVEQVEALRMAVRATARQSADKFSS